MKIISAPFLALVAAMATGVTAGWLPDDGSTFNSYCGSAATRANSLHVCVTTPHTNPDFLAHITKDSNFKGYLSSDKSAFVLLPNDHGATTITDSTNGITLTVAFDVETITPKLGDSCQVAVFHDQVSFFGKPYNVWQPGGESIPWPEVYSGPGPNVGR
ncbi:uncharacterized protein UTRI_10018 [Ustilago trichophora]|uniref:Uncharacterized protein n=1 Tax=Ustilago trichophora TaxID=86804 RepID=A0A5C3DP96_9BASI|nr:uncharacterized protein UTRI_10018 [Ustilago trichophora]